MQSSRLARPKSLVISKLIFHLPETQSENDFNLF